MWQISNPLQMVQVRVFIFVLKSQKLAVFEAKTGLQKQLWQPNLRTFFHMVFGSGEMKDQIKVKFATSLLALLAGG